ncbi:hypothetical protein Ahy_B10g104014 isoform A [Arachis hypogaea]|uniref:Uncharacterized protein n=1 Tax=Arachis hypogaea TaxID=3818 RepID=A0A444X4I2_ARAHY|nr:hypothetical protein Ahy_B10g104014 isoform A [Arachis hypogaea]
MEQTEATIEGNKGHVQHGISPQPQKPTNSDGSASNPDVAAPPCTTAAHPSSSLRLRETPTPSSTVHEIPNFCSTLCLCVVVESRGYHPSFSPRCRPFASPPQCVKPLLPPPRKETPLANDQGIYNRITWWEQIDNEKQLTRNKKPLFFVVLFPLNKKLSIMENVNYGCIELENLKSELQGRKVSRGELWTTAHKRKDGSYIHEEAKIISERIEELPPDIATGMNSVKTEQKLEI